MVIGLLQVQASIPEAHSLKDKRSVVRSLRDRILNRMNVSVAEVGKQDLWKSTELAFVTIADRREVVQKRISEISNVLHATPYLVIIDLQTEFL